MEEFANLKDGAARCETEEPPELQGSMQCRGLNFVLNTAST